MASELYVETLKGLTSGANANKVIIPAGQTLDVSAGTVSGITEGVTNATIYKLNGNSTQGSGVIITDWELADHSLAGSIGTAVSRASGVFTFPSTGIWLVKFSYVVYSGSGAVTYCGGNLQATTDNGSNWSNVTTDNIVGLSGTNDYNIGFAEAIFDITDVSNQKVRVQTLASSTFSFAGDGTANRTKMLFLRLGDT